MQIFLKIDYAHHTILQRIIDWFEKKFGFMPTPRQTVQFVLHTHNIDYSKPVEEMLKLAYYGIKEFSVKIGHLELSPSIVEKLDKIIRQSELPTVGYSEVLCAYLASFYLIINDK